MPWSANRAAAILAARFRADTRYRLVARADLDAAHGSLLQGLDDETDLYGLLLPTDNRSRPRVIERQAAGLLRRLRRPSPLPASLRRSPRRSFPLIARLVLDGIVGIERRSRFVSGPDALSVFAPGDRGRARGPAARLSARALRYAQSLRLDDARALSDRLYRYHVEPASPEWRRRLGSRAAVAAWLGLDGYGANATLASWSGGTQDARRGHWITWTAPGGRLQRHRGAMYKLYVSPATTHVRECLGAVIGTLDGRASLGWKVGADMHNLLRPDKLVVYFATRDDLEAVGTQLARRLRGMPVHGVPLTATQGCGHLLSWGLDPPAATRAVNAFDRGSWRSWVSRRLASALVTAQGADAHPALARRYALTRLAFEGVDTRTWSPVAGLWMPDAP